MLLGTLSGSLLGNMLVGKGAIATRYVILRVSLGMGVTDRGQKRVKHQQCSDKAKTSYLGIFWGGEFDEIDNVWWNWKFAYLRAIFVVLGLQKWAKIVNISKKVETLHTKNF